MAKQRAEKGHSVKKFASEAKQGLKPALILRQIRHD